MFVEPRFNNPSTTHTGWIEVVCGSMFSGKTEELIRRVTRALIAKQRVLIFKPSIDVRYDDKDVVSHNKNAVTSVPVNNAKEIYDHVSECDVVAIDEAQFFDNDLVEVCTELANNGLRVIVCGLDMDFMGQPFEPMPQLMSVAEFVTKLHAVCMKCGEPAQFSYRFDASGEQVVLGESDVYEARCRKCYCEGMKTQKEVK
ncbi:thymidine kinase [Limibacter armeniacum]|uniref:thymidine kinase n=1 Tax=Limibacter armeniacum TaxID=466084 RepID=UPI002FE57453